MLLHFPLLTLPFHWDEAGQFVPAALDLYREGSWVAHSVPPNVHPPGLAAILAAVWHVTGFSLVSTRLTMLAIAALGVYFSFLLAIRLSRVAWGAPAFPAILFLLAAPLMETQSMSVLLDLPAMTFTVLALLLFLNERWVACAAACTALVLIKETGLSTPLVFAAWLWFRDRRRREALYFLAPVAALGIWLVALRSVTGSWFGNPGFATYNVAAALTPPHVLYAFVRRLYFLFVADGHWIGAIALYFGWRTLRGRDWSIAGAVAVAQLAVVTLLGGAVLERYLLPVLPIFYAAVAVAATVFTRRVRVGAYGAMLLLLVAGWVWDSPFPAPLENNLSMVDFVRLQETGAQFLEAYAREARIAAAWPFTNAIADPDLGYVQRPLMVVRMPDEQRSDFAALDVEQADVAVVFSRGYHERTGWLEAARLRALLERYAVIPPLGRPATQAEMQELGFASVARWALGGEWIEIYARDSVPATIARR